MSVAGSRTEVRAGLSRNRDEFVLVGVHRQRQFENTVCIGKSPLAIRATCQERVRRYTAGANDELDDAFFAIKASVRILRGEALIQMIVAAQDDLGAVVV